MKAAEAVQSDNRQTELARGCRAEYSQPEVRSDRRMVREVLPDTLTAHRGDVHVAPDVAGWEVHADPVDVLTGNDAIDGRIRLNDCGLLLVGCPRVVAAVLVRHGPRLLAKHTLLPRSVPLRTMRICRMQICR